MLVLKFTKSSYLHLSPKRIITVATCLLVGSSRMGRELMVKIEWMMIKLHDHKAND